MFSAMMTSVRLLVCLHFKEKKPTKHRLKYLKDGTLQYASGPTFTIRVRPDLYNTRPARPLQYAGSCGSYSSLEYIDYIPINMCRFRQINHCLFLAKYVSFWCSIYTYPTPMSLSVKNTDVFNFVFFHANFAIH